MKTVDAKNFTKTFDWIFSLTNDVKQNISNSKNDDGYLCTIFLPLINKTIVGLGDTSLEAVDKATTQCSKLIDEYLKTNKSPQIRPLFGNKNCFLEENENGEIIIHLREE